MEGGGGGEVAYVYKNYATGYLEEAGHYFLADESVSLSCSDRCSWL